MKRYFIMSIVSACFLVSNVLADTSASKQSIVSLFQKTKQDEMFKQTMAQVGHMVASQSGEKAKKEFDEFSNSLNIQDLFDKIIPIYQKYYSQEDIDNLNKFYDSPTGKKFIRTAPQTIQETVQVSMKWAMDAFKKIEKKEKAK